MLRYTLLDARARAPPASGVDSARYADPTVQRGLLGALRRSADNVARTITRPGSKGDRDLAAMWPFPQEVRVSSSEPVPFLNPTQRAGKKLGVDVLLVGEVAVRPNGDLAITGRVVSAGDAEVQQVIYVTGPSGQPDRLEQAFRRRLAKPVAGWVNRQLDQLRQAPLVWPDAISGR